MCGFLNITFMVYNVQWSGKEVIFFCHGELEFLVTSRLDHFKKKCSVSTCEPGLFVVGLLAF